MGGGRGSGLGIGEGGGRSGLGRGGRWRGRWEQGLGEVDGRRGWEKESSKSPGGWREEVEI